MSFFEGLLTAGRTILSGISTEILSVASKVGSAVSRNAQKFFEITEKIPSIEKICLVVDCAVKIIDALARFLEIISEDDSEILGAKAKQAEKTINDFDNNTEEYINYLKNEVELDEKVFNEMTTEERMACRITGMALELRMIEEKLAELEIPPELIIALSKAEVESGIVISSEKLVQLFENLKESGITDLNDIVDYLEARGKINRIETGHALRDAVEKIGIQNPVEFVANWQKAVRSSFWIES